MNQAVHIGLSLGRFDHWNDGLGTFGRQLGLALSAHAAQLREERGWCLHFHMPLQFHGSFGDAVGYLSTHTSQRWLHLQPKHFALWHSFHQHNRLRAPLGTERQLETVHDLNFLHLKQGAKIDRYRRAQRRRLQRCDAVVAITQHVARDIEREMALPGLPVEVMHGATDLSDSPREAVTGLPSAPWLLHISRMAPSKNIEALLTLAAAWPEQPIVLAGATSRYSAEVQAQVARRGLTNVHIRRDLSEAQKAWLYANCCGFLFPSLTEGFGAPPIEAMYFGKSAFLSRLTSLPEVGGAVAHYFDNFDGAAMRKVVQSGMAEDARPDRAFAITAHARQFSWSRCAEAYLDLYARLLVGK